VILADVVDRLMSGSAGLVLEKRSFAPLFCESALDPDVRPASRES